MSNQNANDRTERIRERAHRIWEEEGRPEGRESDHWSRAAAEVDAEGADAVEANKAMGEEVGGGKAGGRRKTEADPGTAAVGADLGSVTTAKRATGREKKPGGADPAGEPAPPKAARKRTPKA
jgi:Protein of unknown function (DUF2934)